MKLGKLQRKWVNSLKAHPERQYKRRLGKRSPDGAYMACCLGEAAMIMGTCKFDSAGFIVERGSESDADLERSYTKIGLIGPNGEVDTEMSDLTLAVLNDDKHHTWTDIAYMIEAAPELFFTKSV